MVNSKQTDAYLLGEINAKVTAVLENQTEVMKTQKSQEKKIEALENKNAFNKGFIAAVAVIGGTIGTSLVYVGKVLFSFLFITH